VAHSLSKLRIQTDLDLTDVFAQLQLVCKEIAQRHANAEEDFVGAP
jgi:hypothetical protein